MGRERRGERGFLFIFIFLPVVGEDDKALEEAVAARGAAAESGEAELGGDEGEAAPLRRPHPIIQLLHLVLDLRRPYAVVLRPRRHGLPRSEPSTPGSDDRERAAPARPPRNVVRASMALDRSTDRLGFGMRRRKRRVEGVRVVYVWRRKRGEGVGDLIVFERREGSLYRGGGRAQD